jgi:hypothetical protein
VGAENVNYWLFDNEWGIWHTTHRDVHPNPVTYLLIYFDLCFVEFVTILFKKFEINRYGEVWQDLSEYAAAVRNAYPNDVVCILYLFIINLVIFYNIKNLIKIVFIVDSLSLIIFNFIFIFIPFLFL